MKTGLFLDGSSRQFPDLFGGCTVLGVGHQHVGGQTMGESAHLARGAAGRWLAGEGEGAVARFADLAGEQVQVVDQVVGPDATGVLVEAHGPERHDLAFGVGVQLGQGLEALGRHAAFPGGALQGVGFDEGGELLEGHVLPGIGLGRVLGLHLQRVVGTQTVADIVGAAGELGVLADEVLVHRAACDDVVGDVVEDQQIGLRFEHQRDIGQVEAAVLEGGQHGDLGVRMAEATISDPAPEDGVHFGHVRAPQHEGVGDLDVVVAAHRLVHAEGTHEAHHRRSHAVARVGVDVVGAETGLHQLVGGVAFPHRPLP